MIRRARPGLAVIALFAVVALTGCASGLGAENNERSPEDPAVLKGLSEALAGLSWLDEYVPASADYLWRDMNIAVVAEGGERVYAHQARDWVQARAAITCTIFLFPGAEVAPGFGQAIAALIEEARNLLVGQESP